MLPFNIPANALAVVELRATAPLLQRLGQVHLPCRVLYGVCCSGCGHVRLFAVRRPHGLAAS
jgi:hypothetical protein